jgi:hypothetical protein
MEVWSIGEGRSRVYCGVAATDDGFAVDVFRGDTCLESVDRSTQGEAVHQAGALRRRYEALCGTSGFELEPADAFSTDWIGGGCTVVAARQS